MKEVPINFLAVLVAAVANYIIAGIWHGLIFAKTWSKLTGISEMKPTFGKVIGHLIAVFVMGYVLANALVFAATYTNMSGISAGLMVGFFNWLGFVAPATFIGVLYEKRKLALWFIDNAYWLISLLVMGVILAVWK